MEHFEGDCICLDLGMASMAMVIGDTDQTTQGSTCGGRCAKGNRMRYKTATQGGIGEVEAILSKALGKASASSPQALRVRVSNVDKPVDSKARWT